MDKDRNLVVLTTISCIIFSFIGPLVIWLTKKDELAVEVKDYITNLLNFELTLLLVGVAVGVLGIIPILGFIIGAIAVPLLMLINVILIIIATLKVTNNELFKFPFTINLIK